MSDTDTAAPRVVGKKKYAHRNHVQGKPASIWLDAVDQERIANLTDALDNGIQRPSLIILVRAGLKLLDDYVQRTTNVV
jgi:hypothetical protein